MDDLEDGLDKIQEIVQQCRIAINYEKSRRRLQNEINIKTEKDSLKKMRKNDFKLRRRLSRLKKATPYRSNSQQSIGE